MIYCINCFSQRYLTDDYLVLDSIIGGTYGTALDYQSNTQNLLFDFYEPANDTLTKRPLIIYIHGGGFTSGSRTYPSVQMLCRRMANKGYAVANIDYRLDPNFDIYDSNSDRRAMTDAMHDAKQAIRYFKTNASNFKIDTSLIFIGGESAGAATAMMASFVDKQSEMNSYPMAIPNDPIGSTVNSNVGNKVAGTLCLCGLLLDTLAIETPSDPPILWVHGTNDNFVPFSLAYIIVSRALNVGLPIQTKVYQEGVHCPWYFGNPNWATYLDSTVNEITSFLYPKVSTITAIDSENQSNILSIYPNPFQSILTIDFNGDYSETIVRISTISGQIIFEKPFNEIENNIQIDLTSLDTGAYFISIKNDSFHSVQKVVKSW